MAAALRPLSGPTFRADLANYRGLLQRQLEASQQRLEVQAEKAGLHVDDIRCVVRAGAPATVIAAVAGELDADLIIVGRGSGGKLGSVAEHTVRLVGRLVLVAPVLQTSRRRARLPISARRRGGRIRA